jgi:hypothetical protein
MSVSADELQVIEREHPAEHGAANDDEEPDDVDAA